MAVSCFLSLIVLNVTPPPHARTVPSPTGEKPPAGPGWIHEIKHDGFRILARRDARGVRLFTATGMTYRALPEDRRSGREPRRVIDGEAAGRNQRAKQRNSTLRRLVASLGSLGPAGISANVAAGCALDQWQDLFLDWLNPAGRLGPLGPVPLDEINAVVTVVVGAG